MLNVVAKHYHGNIDDAFDLFLNFARFMDNSQSDLVATSPSLLKSIDFNIHLDPVFELGMAEWISPHYEDTVKQYKAKRMQEKGNEPPSKKQRLSLSKHFHDPVSSNSLKKAVKGVLPKNTQQSNNWAVKNLQM